MKRILVTGAGGFCGRHLCSYLAQKSHPVVGTYRGHTPQGLKGVRLLPLEMTDRQGVDDLIRRVRPSFVYHLAAQSVPRYSFKEPEKTFDANAAGTLYLLDALRRWSPHARILLASSIQVYGHSFRRGKAVGERDLLWPESPYAASKIMAEGACLDFMNRFGISVVIARAFNHLGRGQPLHFVFSDWCRQIALAEIGQHRPVLEVGNLEAYRDFLHVRDVLSAYTLLMKKGRDGAIYNICSGKVRLLRDYVDFLLQKAKVAMRVEVQKKRLRRYDPSTMKGNASKLRALGWRPRHSPFKALEELLNEWRTKLS